MKDMRYDSAYLDDKSIFWNTSTTMVTVMLTHTRAGLDGVTESSHGALSLACISAFDMGCYLIRFLVHR